MDTKIQCIAIVDKGRGNQISRSFTCMTSGEKHFIDEKGERTVKIVVIYYRICNPRDVSL